MAESKSECQMHVVQRVMSVKITNQPTVVLANVVCTVLYLSPSRRPPWLEPHETDKEFIGTAVVVAYGECRFGTQIQIPQSPNYSGVLYCTVIQYFDSNFGRDWIIGRNE